MSNVYSIVRSLLVATGLWLLLTSKGLTVPMNSFTPPTNITVRMYRLLIDGSSTGILCSPNDTSYGCTAFVGDPSHAYPYGSSNPVTIPIETDYLLDVVPQELPPYYHPTALQAQAIAARSYAYWHIHQGSAINNSTQFQAFIPYKFESLQRNVTPDNPISPCASHNLNTDQSIVCNAVAPRHYVSYGSYPHDDLPAFTEFFADAWGYTVSGSKPYLQGVEDPISTGCDANNFGHRRGMSQEGASRWVRGNQCSYASAGDVPWSVRWEHAEQVLTHYYTGIHIRNASGEQLTSAYRWNALQLNNTPTHVSPGHTSYVSIWLQNTGTASWFGAGGGGPISPTHALSYRIFDLQGNCTANCTGANRSPLDNYDEKAPGDDLWRTLQVHFPPTIKGPVVVRFDMVQLSVLAQRGASQKSRSPLELKTSALTANVDFWFADYGQGWYTQDIPVCVGGCVFLPLVGRQF